MIFASRISKGIFGCYPKLRRTSNETTKCDPFRFAELRKMQIQRSNRIRDCYKNQFNGKIQFLTY